LSVQERSICENLDASYPFPLHKDTFWKRGVEGFAGCANADLQPWAAPRSPACKEFHDAPTLSSGYEGMVQEATDIRSLNVVVWEPAGSQVIRKPEMAECSVRTAIRRTPRNSTADLKRAAHKPC
jgi:hypothetical protein